MNDELKNALAEHLLREYGINLHEGVQIIEETERYLYVKKRIPTLRPTPREEIGLEMLKKHNVEYQEHRFL